MMFKAVIIGLFLALVFHSGVLSAPQLESQNNLLVERLLGEQRDVALTRNSALAREDDIFTNIINWVLQEIPRLLVSLACGVISPYLTVIELFQTTVLRGVSLILQFVANLAANYFTDLADSITQLSSGVTWVNTTISNLTSYISDAGCSAT